MRHKQRSRKYNKSDGTNFVSRRVGTWKRNQKRDLPDKNRNAFTVRGPLELKSKVGMEKSKASRKVKVPMELLVGSWIFYDWVTANLKTTVHLRMIFHITTYNTS